MEKPSYQTNFLKSSGAVSETLRLMTIQDLFRLQSLSKVFYSKHVPEALSAFTFLLDMRHLCANIEEGNVVLKTI